MRTIERTYFPDVRELPKLTYLGGFSWSSPEAKMRIVDRRCLVDIGNGGQTPSEIARDYLAAKFITLPRRAFKDQAIELNRGREVPRYARSGHYEDMAYVDIRSAYYSIVSAIGWNTEYYPGQWWGAGVGVADFPLPEHKIARNCLVSLAQVTDSRLWTGGWDGKLVVRKSWNTLLNRGIFAAIADVLNSIAIQAVSKFGAVYFHTDGAIIPIDMVHSYRAYVRSWGLYADIRKRDSGQDEIGAAWIINPNSYRVGYHATKGFISGVGAKTNVVTSNLEAPDHDWLKLRFSRFARDRVRGLLPEL